MVKMNTFVTFALMLLFKSASSDEYICDADKKPAFIDKLTEIDRNRPIYQGRVFPLCWKNDPSKLDKFISNHASGGKKPFKLLLDATDERNSKNPKDFVPIAKDFDFSLHRILVPDPYVRNMRQWLRLTITPKATDVKIVAGIVQAVSSPLGLPFGQFKPDISCDDGVTAFDDGKGEQDVIPCLYRPKSAYQHPNVYVVWTDDTLVSRSISVSFSYINVLCNEVTAFQFMLAVYDHADRTYFEMSPVYVLKKVDSAGGFPSPYHASWRDKILCNDNTATLTDCVQVCNECRPTIHGQLPTDCPTRELMSEHITTEKDRRIIYDADFDNCIQNDQGRDGNECPPGPFFCHETRSKAATENNKITDTFPNIALEDNTQAYITRMTKSWASCPIADCRKEFEIEVNKFCAAPGGRSLKDRSAESEKTDAPTDDNKDKALDHLRKKTATLVGVDRTQHGKYMIGAWFVVDSISIFMARYYKETGGVRPETANGCCDMRCWLWGHLGLAYAFMFFMWNSVIRPMELLHCHPVVYQNSTVDFKALSICVANPPTIVLIHNYVGFAAMALAHVTFVIGFIRPLKPRLRNICTAFHSFSGHVLPYIALVPVFLSNVKWLIKLSVLGLVGANIVSHIVASWFQRRSDSRQNLPAKRKLFPILEVLKQHDCVILDTIGILIHSIVLFAIYGFILYLYTESPKDSKQ